MAKVSDIFGRFRKEAADADYQEYLLGGLSSARRTAIEQSSIFDDHVCDSLLAAEEALLQGYTEGSLTPDVRKRFEALVDSSAAWRQKAKLAKALSSLIRHRDRSVFDLPLLPNELSPPVGPGDFGSIFGTPPAGKPLPTPAFQGVLDELSEIATEHLTAEKGTIVDALRSEPQLSLAANIEDDHRHIFEINMAKTMRRILTEKAKLLRAGGASERSELEQTLLSIDASFASLEVTNPRAGRIFELVVFGGLSLDAAAEVLGVSSRTAKRDWAIARSLLASAGYQNEQ